MYGACDVAKYYWLQAAAKDDEGALIIASSLTRLRGRSPRRPSPCAAAIDLLLLLSPPSCGYLHSLWSLWLTGSTSSLVIGGRDRDEAGR
ncbi:hypothetical protein GW17_00026972 [Ensete ventricosum]|nr:hypothetical protein GW17_00026972 [Ensete ventricosum]RZS14174.1 hypothetical protein BHM03_00045832 [Ensete ventricosum]